MFQTKNDLIAYIKEQLKSTEQTSFSVAFMLALQSYEMEKI